MKAARDEFIMNTNSKKPTRRKTGFLSNLRVNRKLGLLNLVMGMGIVVIYTTGILGMRDMRYHLTNIYDYRLIPVAEINQTETVMADIQARLAVLKSQDMSKAEQQDVFSSIKTLETVVLNNIGRYDTQWVTTANPEFNALLSSQDRLELQEKELATLQQLHTDFNSYLTARDEFEIALLSGHYNEGLADATQSAVTEARGQLRRLIDVNRAYAEFSIATARMAYTRSLSIMGITLTIAGILAVFLGVAISRSIIQRLTRVQQAATTMQRGNLLQRAEVYGSDEIASLANAFNRMSGQLNQTVTELEQRVHERTLELETVSAFNERRARQFAAIAQVAGAISASQGLESLLPQIARVISRQFGFYHVGIFLLDSTNEYAILRAANSEGGAQMLKRGHKLRVGQTGIVGAVAENAKPRVVLDTGADAVFFNNPDLPNTHSEMALPLFAAGRKVIGVLDVQSEEANAFRQEDIETLSTLSDQVSIAIANARLFEETRRALNEADVIYRRNLRAGWSKFTRAQKLTGIRRIGGESSILSETLEIPGMKDASRSGEIHSGKNITQDGDSHLTIPIKLRDEVVGVLNVHTDAGRDWSQDDLDIVTAIIERAALSIENARLLSESQKLANKERVISEIAAKVSSHTNRDNILQVAVSEIGRMIPGAEVVIQFRPNDAQE